MHRTTRSHLATPLALGAAVAFAAFATSDVAAAGGGLPATLTIHTIQAEPGSTAAVGVWISVDDLIGSFSFDAIADGLLVDDIVYDGPLFSQGWDGWDTAPSTSPNISAACIFPADQVTGQQALFTMMIDVPADAKIGSSYTVDFTSAMVTNYEFAQFDVTVVPGEIEIIEQCHGDIAGDDGVVGVSDLLIMLADFGDLGGPADLNGDGIVDIIDLVTLLSAWGGCA